MNIWWIAAGTIAAFTAAVHLIAGHKAPLGVMLEAPFEAVSKRTMHAVWHLVSVDLVLAGGALLAAGAVPDRVPRALPAIVAVQHTLFAIVFVVIGLASGLERGLWKLPQWTLMVPIAALSAAGYA